MGFFFMAYEFSDSSQLPGASLREPLSGQAEQGDEAVSIVVVVKITGGEGSQGLVVEAVGRSGFRL